nr:complement control protein [Botryllus schlosseri]
ENVCEEGGEWKYRWTPKCRKYCVFERDEACDENIVHSAIQRRFEYKAEIHFKCKRSTLLVGDDYIKCGEDGVWEKKIPKCVPVCYRPTVQNGKLLDDKSLTDVFVEGDTAEISCDDGFRPERAGKVTCLSGGEWDMEEFCISNKQRCSEKEVRNGGARPKEPWYEPGASVRYFCHIGHILTHGDGSNVCMSDGTWKFPVPNCRGHSTTSFCAGRCGRRSDYRRYPCQCNITCRWFKNCCSDFAETCPGSGN